MATRDIAKSRSLDRRVLVIVHAALPTTISTSAVAMWLGPSTSQDPPRCGHNDCTRPEHAGQVVSLRCHGQDATRASLVRLMKRGHVERVAAPRVANGTHFWRFLSWEPAGSELVKVCVECQAEGPVNVALAHRRGYAGLCEVHPAAPLQQQVAEAAASLRRMGDRLRGT